MLDLDYENPPITEAIIDIRVKLPEDFMLEQLPEDFGSFLLSYPDKKWMTKQEGEILFESDSEPKFSSISKKVGIALTSEDQERIAQFRIDGFTLSQLRPYRGWAKFKKDSEEAWNAYRNIFTPARVSRLAVRFINRLDLPLQDGRLEFEDYLKTYPELSPDFAKDMGGFFMKLLIPRPDYASDVILQQGVMNSSESNVVSILLDIDAFREIDEEASSPEIWNIFDALRNLKNEAFKHSITERTEELFKS